MDNQTDHIKSVLFLRLLFGYQAAALQQMGKLVNPLDGSVSRDLEQARISIDTLDMLRDKCKGNLSESEERLLNQIISDLKLNYVDEINRPSEPEANLAVEQTVEAETPAPES